MREIKFRAWDTTKYKDKPRMVVCGFERLGSWHEAMGHEIMQYTGLKDKNGKEIYEGDIVKVDGGYGPWLISFSERERGWRSTRPDVLAHVRIGPTDRIYEVIGNTHENPKLLEGNPID